MIFLGKNKVYFLIFTTIVFACTFGAPKVHADTTVGVTMFSPGLQNGLVGHWTFDGKDMVSNIADSSGNENNGYLRNFDSGTTTFPGPIGQKLEFLGDDDWIQVPDDDSLDITGEITIAGWARFDILTRNQGILYKGPYNNSWGTYSIAYITSSSPDGLYLTIGDANHVVISSDLTKEVWYHFVATYDGSEANIYLNGEIDATDTSGVSLSADANDVQIGRYLGSSINRYLNGQLDDIRLYNRALSAEEAKRLYGLGATTHIGVTPVSIASATQNSLSYGLVGHWTFDGKDMYSNVADLSGNGNTGYLLNQSPTTTVPGRIGQALEFDGTNDYIDISDSDSLTASNAITMSAWIKNDQYPTAGDVYTVFKKRVTTSDSYQLNVADDGSVRLGIDTGAYTTLDGTTDVLDGSWHHILGRWDGATMEIFIDGISENSTAKGGTMSNTANNLGIGWHNSADAADFDFYNGYLDDLRIYDRALSNEEIKRLYGLGATTHIGTTVKSSGTNLDSGLVGHWTFDGKNMYDNVEDVSGLGNTGRLKTGTSTIPGVIGQAFNFGGANAVKIDNESNFDFLNTTFTASAWVKTSAPSRVVIFGKDTINAGGWNFRIDGNNSGQAVVGIDTSASATAYSRTSVESYNDGEWHHIVAVITTNTSSAAGNTATIYVDGVADNDTETQSSVAGGTNAPLYIGVRRNEAGSTFSDYFDGYIDDARIYNRALSVEEIQRLYDLGR